RTFEKQCPVLRTCPTGACIRNLSAEALFEKFSSGRMSLLHTDSQVGKPHTPGDPPQRKE
ncbi:MAG TPA: hypothetical protein VLE89_06045, partial [Chlamydiales bacterium]|nr:hypothetical protein [Chlamydiales bacterium]